MSAIAQYLAKRILGGHVKYDKVVKTYPQYKDDIDEYLNRYHYFDA